MKLSWPRDDPRTPARLGRLVRALLLALVPVVLATLVLARRALVGEWSPALATALLLLVLLAFLLLQAARMAIAWRREILAASEDRTARPY